MDHNQPQLIQTNNQYNIEAEPNLDDLNLSDGDISINDFDDIFSDIESLFPKKILERGGGSPVPINPDREYLRTGKDDLVTETRTTATDDTFTADKIPQKQQADNINTKNNQNSNSNSTFTFKKPITLANRRPSTPSTLYDSDYENEEILRTLQKNVKENEQTLKKDDEDLLKQSSSFANPSYPTQPDFNNFNNLETRSLSSLSCQSQASTSTNVNVNNNLPYRRISSKNSRKRGSSQNINEIGKAINMNVLKDVRSIKFTGFGKSILEEISYQNSANLDYLYNNRDTFNTMTNTNQKRSKLSALPVDIDDGRRARRKQRDRYRDRDKNRDRDPDRNINKDVIKMTPSCSELSGDEIDREIDTFYTPDLDPRSLSDVDLSRQLAKFNLRRAKLIKTVQNHEKDLEELDKLRKLKENALKHDRRTLELLGEKIIKYRQLETDRITSYRGGASAGGNCTSSRIRDDSIVSEGSTMDSSSSGIGLSCKDKNPPGLDYYCELD